jgi:hypothetical protein
VRLAAHAPPGFRGFETLPSVTSPFLVAFS